MEIDLKGIHWVIVGGESGPRARKMEPAWVEAIFAQCKSASVPFFFKQWGGVRKDLTGRLLHNRTYDEMPSVYSAAAC
jgi:protein gp37